MIQRIYRSSAYKHDACDEMILLRVRWFQNCSGTPTDVERIANLPKVRNVDPRSAAAVHLREQPFWPLKNIDLDNLQFYPVLKNLTVEAHLDVPTDASVLIQPDVSDDDKHQDAYWQRRQPEYYVISTVAKMCFV